MDDSIGEESMGDQKTRPLASNTARLCGEIYVPSLFETRAPIRAAAANNRHGHEVLNVACASGLAAMTVSDCVGAGRKGKTSVF